MQAPASTDEATWERSASGEATDVRWGAADDLGGLVRVDVMGRPCTLTPRGTCGLASACVTSTCVRTSARPRAPLTARSSSASSVSSSADTPPPSRRSVITASARSARATMATSRGSSTTEPGGSRSRGTATRERRGDDTGPQVAGHLSHGRSVTIPATVCTSTGESRPPPRSPGCTRRARCGHPPPAGRRPSPRCAPGPAPARGASTHRTGDRAISIACVQLPGRTGPAQPSHLERPPRSTRRHRPAPSNDAAPIQRHGSLAICAIGSSRSARAPQLDDTDLRTLRCRHS